MLLFDKYFRISFSHRRNLLACEYETQKIQACLLSTTGIKVTLLYKVEATLRQRSIGPEEKEHINVC